MDKKILLEKLKDSVCGLILQEVEMKRIHDKKYMDASNYIDERGNFLFFRNHTNIIIISIFHILDSENKDNISFKNLISDNPKLVGRFNDIFCSKNKAMNNKNVTFQYSYNDNIQKIKKYRNNRGGHNSFNYKLEHEENSFLYTDIYNTVEKIEEFFKEVYMEITGETIFFSSLREECEKKRDSGIKNIIRAAELLKADKERELIEFKNKFINSIT